MGTINVMDDVYAEFYTHPNVDGHKYCKFYEECKSGVKYKNSRAVDKFLFDRAKVGKNYGEDGVPRIVIVGIEGFASERIVNEYKTPSLDNVTNAHYNGVKYIISYLLADFLGHNPPPIRITNHGADWINDALQRYALCNLYRCAFVPENDTDRIRGLYHSSAMQEHCIELLIREIHALKPDIVVIQCTNFNVFSEDMRNRINNEFSIKWDNENQSPTTFGVGRRNSKPLSFIYTYHGAYPKFKAQEFLKNSLNPALDEAITKYKEQLK